MNCPLGVNAFRSSVQITAQQCSRPATSTAACIRLPTFLSRRSIASWPLSGRKLQQHQSLCSTIATSLILPRSLQWPCSPSHRIGLRTIFSGHSVSTHYVDLPPNYTDEVGLPFRRSDLNTQEVLAIFGTGTSTHTANKLLWILHGRRVAGTLEDPELQINTLGFTARERKIALEFLRKHVPVDEVTNAGLRAEDELAAMEEGDEGTAEEKASHDPGYKSRFKIYEADEDAAAAAGGQPKDVGVYGMGAFDTIRARNKIKYEAELKRREEQKRIKEEEFAKAHPGDLQTIDGKPQRQLSPRMQEWAAKATSDLEAPPEMKTWERLLPSTVVVVLFVGFLLAYSAFYRPPSRADRLFPDIPPAAATVGMLIAVNLLIVAAWRIPPLWGFLNRYFMVVPATPRPLSTIGAMFSHHQFLTHLVPNMVLLWFFGVRLHDEVGRADFLATYLASGSIGFLATMTTLVLRRRLDLTTIGASGAIYGVFGAYFWMNRFEGFKFFGLPPDPSSGVPGLAFIGLLAGLNLAAFTSSAARRIDVTSHLAGMSVGLLAGHLLERKKEAKKQRRLVEAHVSRAVVPGNTADMGGVDKLILDRK
ncbi:hypothetical protein B0T22DRAFT_61128 [Podospora appendiculata]|uniref:Peptidase S54 rhomboid domain-containing protein n=1 Tax=Podospora appendiculata TaxID=314037 RepID=A0AAE1CH29_9PEZI|nr:hypothetical protein B0T22DRAFT_61128 [Podospora appendiculata]